MLSRRGTILCGVASWALVYPSAVVGDPLIVTEQAKLIRSAVGSFDYFGGSVAIDADTAVVGAPAPATVFSDDEGVAYVFLRNNDIWSEQAILTASDVSVTDSFGASVGISGNTIVVGDPDDNGSAGADQGSAYVFVRNGVSWTQQAKLTASDAAAQDHFGAAVGIDGNRIIVGAWGDDGAAGTDQGSAYVFVRTGTTWNAGTKLPATDLSAFDELGTSVAIKGVNAIVGAPRDDGIAGINQGSAYIYFFQAGFGGWIQQTKLTATDAGADDFFGAAVSISGLTVAIGAPYDTGASGFEEGSAYVFVYSAPNWIQQQKVVANDVSPNDSFGISVALSGDRLVVGAPNDDSPLSNAGSMYVFGRTGTIWGDETRETASDDEAEALFGASVAISAETIIAGSPRWDTPPLSPLGSRVGAAYAFAVSMGITCSLDADCDDDMVCTCDKCMSSLCTQSNLAYGNVNCAGPDDQVNLDDILCVLQGFAAFANCPNGDLAPPCTGNDTIDLDDILKVLAAFAGVDPCGCTS